MRPFGRILLATVFVGVLLALPSGAAQSTTREAAASSATISQRVDLDSNDALLWLALGRGTARFEDIADFDRTITRSSSFDRDVDLDRDTTLFALALDGGGSGARRALLGDTGFGSFGTFGVSPFFGSSRGCDSFGFGSRNVLDISCAQRVGSTVTQRVDLDEDTVLSALALGRGSFGGFGSFGLLGGGFGRIPSIANFDRTTTTFADFDRTVGLDRDDVLLGLALGR